MNKPFLSLGFTFFIALLMSACVTTYQRMPFDYTPMETSWNTIDNPGLQMAIDYNVLTGAGMKPYAKMERKNNVNMVIVTLHNTGEQDVILSRDVSFQTIDGSNASPLHVEEALLALVNPIENKTHESAVEVDVPTSIDLLWGAGKAANLAKKVVSHVRFCEDMQKHYIADHVLVPGSITRGILVLPVLRGTTVVANVNTNMTQPIKTYQQGLDSCQSIRDAHQLTHPGEFIFTDPMCMLGAQMPEFSIMSMDSVEINLDYFKGKYTILNFWSTYCAPCIAEIPGLNAIVDKYGRDEFNYVAIGPDEPADITAMLKNHPWNFTQVPSAMSLMFDTLRMRWGYPTTFVLNKDAVIIAAFSGGKTNEEAVKIIEDRLTAIIENASINNK